MTDIIFVGFRARVMNYLAKSESMHLEKQKRHKRVANVPKQFPNWHGSHQDGVHFEEFRPQG
ncbi:MAG TPA: hypothetical protein DDZ97_00180 [Deltaproteobacteria bacterium]|nr:hypothetical protein [Deltaproteobacteria bacterium]